MNLIKFYSCSTALKFYSKKKFTYRNFLDLWKINEKNRNGQHKYCKLIDILCDIRTLKTAYYMIKLNPENMTSVDIKNETLDEIDDKWFKNISEQLKNHTFKFKKVIQTIILKPSKQDKRIFTIYNPRDKIVQQAIKIMLELIFKSHFSNFSHSFKKQKGCHMVLNQIKKNWMGTSWFLEFNIHKCYDEMDKQILIEILRKKINDQQFIDVIYKWLNIEMLNSLKFNNKKSMLQDVVISPILSNIYLNKLDIYVKKLCKQKKINTNKYRKINNYYIKIANLSRIKKFKNLSKDRQMKLINQKKRLTGWMNITKTNGNDNIFLSIHYVRFVDDMLFSIAGPKSVTIEVKKNVTSFIENKLKLKLIGSTITHIASGKIKFLGMWIQGVLHSKIWRNYGKKIENKRRIKHRLKLLIEIKQNRINKAVQSALKKAIAKSVKAKSFKKQKWDINKFEEIINLLLNDKIFTQASIESYSDFVKSLSLNNMFVPSYVKSSLTKLDIDLDTWKNSYLNKITIKKNEQKTHIVKWDQRYSIPLQIRAPLDEIRQKFINRDILTKKNKPKAVNKMLTLFDDTIVSWFRIIGQNLLNYYRCCDNFFMIKNYVDYFIRWSAIHTFAKKHKKSCAQIISIYSKNLNIYDINGMKIVSLLSFVEIKRLNKEFLININENSGLKTLNNIWIKYIKSKTKI